MRCISFCHLASSRSSKPHLCSSLLLRGNPPLKPRVWPSNRRRMAPRQRLSPSPSIEESAEIAEGSMSQPNASSSIPTAPLNERHPTSESSKSLEAEIARERHDIFNIFALVRYQRILSSHIFVICVSLIAFSSSFLLAGPCGDVYSFRLGRIVAHKWIWSKCCLVR